MQITIDTATATPKEGRELVSMLTRLFGEPEPAPLIPLPVRDAPLATAIASPAPPPPATLESAVLAPTASPDPAASIPPPSSPPSAAGVPEYDVHGVPWDERIHATTKTKNTDGSWRNKRGVDPALVASVTAQLTGAPAAPAPVAPAAPPAPGFPTQVASEPAPVVPPPPADGPSPAQRFQAIMLKVTQGTTSGAFDMAEVNNAVAQCGLATVAQVLQHPDKMDLFEALIDGLAAG